MDTSWWSFQLFKSKLIGTPIYHEILTTTNSVVKIIFFEGVAFDRNAVAGFIHARTWGYGIFYLNLDQHDLPKLTEAQKLTVDQLVRTGIAVPEYETHPYHKLKNPALIGYDKGPKFDAFTQVFSEVLYEGDLVVELDILTKEKPDEQV